MELQEIVNRSISEKYIYPDVFTDDCGLDSVIPGESLHAIPSWGWRPSNMIRRVTLRISTFRGISCNAIHYYGALDIQGVYMEVDGEPGHSMSSYVWERDFPLSSDSYTLKLMRPVTKEDKETDKKARCEADVRFNYQEVGDLTERFNSIDELIEFAKVVFKNRFIGKWELYVESPFDKYKGKISV